MTTGPFNNREIATVFWLLIFLVWALQKANIRKSLFVVLRSCFRPKILILVYLMALYTAAVVIVLAAIDLWNASLLKDTIVWFCFTAMGMMIRSVTSNKTEDIFRTVLGDSIKIVIVLEFLVNTYTFSLPAELAIVPVLTFVAMLGAFTSSHKQYAVVAKIIKRMQTIIGLVILVIVARRSISDLQTLRSLDTLRGIALTPFLSLLFSPFLYIAALVSKYELMFLRLNFGMKKEEKLKRYARRRIFMNAGLNQRKVQHFLSDHAIDLMDIQTEDDVDRLIVTTGNLPDKPGAVS